DHIAAAVKCIPQQSCGTLSPAAFKAAFSYRTMQTPHNTYFQLPQQPCMKEHGLGTGAAAEARGVHEVRGMTGLLPTHSSHHGQCSHGQSCARCSSHLHVSL
ncbi:unnamed protein product, partial [Sphacelaria rigidula]